MAHNPNEAKANFVEHGQGSKFKKKKATTKEKALSWDQKGECSRSKSSSGNASTVGSKVTNLLIADFRRKTNSRKPMWLTRSPRMCLKLTSLQ